MDEVLEGVDWGVGHDYLDDVIVGSTGFEQHLQELQNIFDRLDQYGLSMKLSKCSFFKKQLVYLGHLVDKDGIRPSPTKTAAIERIQPPANLKALKRFLEMTSY